MSEPDASDEPKPKRRSALRHALGGLALLICLVLGALLLERAGLTSFGDWWRNARWSFSDSAAAIRERVKPGMTIDDVHEQIGNGESAYVTPSEFWEDYPEYGARVVYSRRIDNLTVLVEVARIEALK